MPARCGRSIFVEGGDSFLLRRVVGQFECNSPMRFVDGSRRHMTAGAFLASSALEFTRLILGREGSVGYPSFIWQIRRNRPLDPLILTRRCRPLEYFRSESPFKAKHIVETTYPHTHFQNSQRPMEYRFATPNAYVIFKADFKKSVIIDHDVLRCC